MLSKISLRLKLSDFINTTIEETVMNKINDIHNNGNHIQSYIFVGFSLNNSNFHLNFLGGGNKIMATKVFTIPILNSTLNQINDLSYNYNVCIKDIVVSDQDGKSMVKNGVNVEGECTGLIF